MGDNTAIEWTDTTWNPVTGCTKVSPGCKHCYAERLTERFGKQRFTDIILHPDRLDLPLRMKKPRMIFVNSMSDLFHETIPEEYIRRAFEVMVRADWHIFQILTKRAKRLAELAPRLPWPKHIWQGVSIENTDYTWRLTYLRMVPAAIRFLSIEPLLGPIPHISLDGIHWVIVGGESGPRNRPADPAWVRDIRDQCLASGVPFFFKQWGGRTPKTGGRLLDGRRWDQTPRSTPILTPLVSTLA